MSRVVDLSPTVLAHVCAMLNQETPVGNDWRELAHKLGYRGTDLLVWSQSGNPTQALLNAWCSRDYPSIQQLIQYLASMRRNDVVAVIGNGGGGGSSDRNIIVQGFVPSAI